MDNIVRILQELIGVQITANEVILSLKWSIVIAVIIPILFMELWLVKRALYSYLPRRNRQSKKK